MNTDTVNLLPPNLRERVSRAKAMASSCRTALALTVVAAAAAAAAEAGRLEALDARDTAERQAESSQARDDHRRRLEAEVTSLASIANTLKRSHGELPLASVLGAITDALPDRHRLQRVHLIDTGSGLRGEVVAVGGADGTSLFVAALAATKPFERVAVADASAGGDPYVIRFELPSDRMFSVVQGDADVSAEGGKHDE